MPIVGADIDLGETASHAISFTFSRREQKNRSDAELEFIVARCLALGLARLCNAALLGAIVAEALEAFSFHYSKDAALKSLAAIFPQLTSEQLGEAAFFLHASVRNDVR